MICVRCRKLIVGMPVLDRGQYFHQSCWAFWKERHEKECRVLDFRSPLLSVLTLCHRPRENH